jgi:tRNA1Val (adenine37-N6)-methyltransferase
MFHFKQFSILHQTEGLKVNTDGCLLGALSKFENPKHCLDIGTGTGVIAMMLAQQYASAKVTAIELNTIAYQQAELNIQASVFKNQIELLNADFTTYHSEIHYDLIVCNPPYFSNHLQGPNTNKNMALHSDTLPPQLLIEKVKIILEPKGLFMVIYPVLEMEKFKTLAAAAGLFPQRIYKIQNKADKAYRTIIGFGFEDVEPTENTLVLMDFNGQRSEAFCDIMQAFYL